jgi:hypothetical protein
MKMKYLRAAYLVAMAGLCSCRNNDAPQQPEVAALTPEQVVSFKPDSFACVSEEAFSDATEWAIEKARTKFQGMFDALECLRMPVTEHYKVLQVKGNAFEFTQVDSRATDGMWSDRRLLR